jgi:hypothetical protein
MAVTTRDEGLSPDLTAFISNRDVSMAVVTVIGTQWKRQMDHDLEVDLGAVSFRVVSALYGALQNGQTIEVSARRVVDPTARVRHNFDAWNTLSLTQGEHLILGVVRGTSLSQWQGVTAMAVEGPDAPEVHAVRRAYIIETAGGGSTELLRDALRSSDDVLMFFAVNYLRRHVSDRPNAMRLLADAVDVHPPSEAKLELGRALAGDHFFRPANKADAANAGVVKAIADALVQETDDERRTGWAQLLQSCILTDFTDDDAENRKTRRALIEAPGMPAAERVISALESAQASASPNAQRMLRELVRVWQMP